MTFFIMQFMKDKKEKKHENDFTVIKIIKFKKNYKIRMQWKLHTNKERVVKK